MAKKLEYDMETGFLLRFMGIEDLTSPTLIVRTLYTRVAIIGSWF